MPPPPLLPLLPLFQLFPPAVVVATFIPTVAFSIFLLPTPIVGAIVSPPIVPPIVLRRIANLLLHHSLHHLHLLMELRDEACETGVGVREVAHNTLCAPMGMVNCLVRSEERRVRLS